MALAPRPNLAPAKGGAKKSKSSVSTARGKAAQRARNKGSATAKGTTSGSSGQAKAISQMPKRLWEEIEDEVDHLCDIAGKISHSQVGASGWLVSTLNSPLEYAHDMLDAHMRARDGLVYIRVYYVDIDKYLGEMADPDMEDDDGS